MTLWGIDGCRAGWAAASLRGGRLEVRVVPALTALPLEPLDWAAIDIPIGLPEAGPRECDRLARLRLGPRRSSVFSAPVRACLEAASYREALERHRAADGRGLSKQAYNLLPKIREADAWAGSAPCQVLEVHPEASFAAMHGRPLQESKRSRAGRDLRRRLLIDCGPGWEPAPLAGAAEDDVLDALAALWSARRLAAGEAETLGEGPTISF